MFLEKLTNTFTSEKMTVWTPFLDKASLFSESEYDCLKIHGSLYLSPDEMGMMLVMCE